jgi:hypothetical protein
LNEYAQWVLAEIEKIIKGTKKLKHIVVKTADGASVYVLYKRQIYDVIHFETVGLTTYASTGTPALERKGDGRGKFYRWELSDIYETNMEVDRFFTRIEQHAVALAKNIRDSEKANSDTGEEENTEAEQEEKASKLQAAMNELRAKVGA